MKDSLVLMSIYRKNLEISECLIELLERHCQNTSDRPISETLKNKYTEFGKHVHSFIEGWNNDLHVLLRINYELKEIEDRETKELT